MEPIFVGVAKELELKQEDKTLEEILEWEITGQKLVVECESGQTLPVQNVD